MSAHRVRVGIVGLQPGRNWAAVAHLPALRALSDEFEIVGVANSSRASAEAAASSCGIPRAFSDVAEMVASPDVDLVVVTVRVPTHFNVVRAALEGGKHVFCEWPLGRTLEEAEVLAQLARDRGVSAFTSTQSRVTPAILHLKRLVDTGFVGEVLSTSVTGWGRIWGGTVDDLKSEQYLLENANGATLLTIPFAHTIAALRDVLGDVSELSAMLDTRRRRVLATETGGFVPMDAPDQILIAGKLASGASLSMHYQGGAPRGFDGFVWDVHGTDGHLRMTGPTGHTQLVPLELWGGRGEARVFEPIGVPDDGIALEDNVPGNIARVYRRLASDLRQGTRTAPTFDDAVELHRLLDGVERAAREGKRVSVQAPNRALPTV
ncbi:Gfo/Idh/MocA family protein [Corallococcus carmarthensis]|uniref:Gfo/Idh/MocA family oxidoreductase n=1 Tax=Corallococcus carmarthensis TaxID=2316728 RepID=A0A3A8JR75_9BACT|nr:Gfo/Idh/MocA family oxidoreductase [Corallococcus carmarthensis]RKG98312.1 gfo/Idh/MocA family oxidoreductase [Corallococcus carmarthensis]